MQIDDLINTLEQTAAGLRTLRSLIGEQPGVTQVTTQLGLMLGHLTEPAAAAPPPPPSESRRPRRETKKAGAGTIDRNRETPESSGRGVNRLVTIDNGDPMTVAQAAEELGLKPGSVLVGLTPTVQRRTGGHMGGKNVRPYLGSSNGDGPLASGGNGRSSHESRPRFGDATTIPNNPNRVVRGGGGATTEGSAPEEVRGEAREGFPAAAG